MRVDPHLWGVVLSGGEGVRLRALTRQMWPGGVEGPRSVTVSFDTVCMR